MLKWTLLFACVAFLLGCDPSRVSDSSDISTRTKLNSELQIPSALPIAFYVDKSRPDSGINFYKLLSEVTELVAEEYFINAEELSSDSKFQYLFKLSATSDWISYNTKWTSNLSLSVYDRSGTEIYSGAFKRSKSGLVNNYDVVFNLLAKVTKESFNAFLNDQGQIAIDQAIASYRQQPMSGFQIQELLKNLNPATSGTGLFIDQQGSLITAAHVVEECIQIDLRYKGEQQRGKVQASSRLLDVAVVSSPFEATATAAISEDSLPQLGKQVFVTGYPLAGMLSDYPSMTVGTVSSMGGLKGAKGQFQFSAPIQPGNSGGAIVDYQGNVIGIVTSTLNQVMMMENTGTTAQNLNFGTDIGLVQRFLRYEKVPFKQSKLMGNFEQSSKAAQEYTVQVICYR